MPAARGTPVEWDVKARLDLQASRLRHDAATFDLDLTFKADPGAAGRARHHRLGAVRSARSRGTSPDLVRPQGGHSLVLVVGARRTVSTRSCGGRDGRVRVSPPCGGAPTRPSWVAACHRRRRRTAARPLGGRPGRGRRRHGRPADAGRACRAPTGSSSCPERGARCVPTGRDVVLTHELTHVAVGPRRRAASRVWLSEGFAELVAYRPLRLPEATIVAPAARPRCGRPVRRRHCPPTRTSTPAPRTLPAAYGLSLLALRTLADRYGTAGRRPALPRGCGRARRADRSPRRPRGGRRRRPALDAWARHGRRSCSSGRRASARPAARDAQA